MSMVKALLKVHPKAARTGDPDLRNRLPADIIRGFHKITPVGEKLVAMLMGEAAPPRLATATRGLRSEPSTEAMIMATRRREELQGTSSAWAG